MGGTYGAYIGEVFTYGLDLGCGGSTALNGTNINRAKANHTAYGTPGGGGYYFFGGPGADPAYNPSASIAAQQSEAYSWGAHQGYEAYIWWQSVFNAYGSGSMPLRILWGDIEYNGQYNGWKDIITCSTDTPYAIDTSVDRSAFNGYWDYLTNTHNIQPGVYSDAAVWNYIFGTGSDGSIAGTWEWTYQTDCAGYSGNEPLPNLYAFTQTGGCAAQWYGGQPGNNGGAKAALWQWCISVCNGTGDFDQVNANVLPAGY
jgi:hypothetical protein